MEAFKKQLIETIENSDAVNPLELFRHCIVRFDDYLSIPSASEGLVRVTLKPKCFDGILWPSGETEEVIISC